MFERLETISSHEREKGQTSSKLPKKTKLADFQGCLGPFFTHQDCRGRYTRVDARYSIPLVYRGYSGIADLPFLHMNQYSSVTSLSLVWDPIFFTKPWFSQGKSISTLTTRSCNYIQGQASRWTIHLWVQSLIIFNGRTDYGPGKKKSFTIIKIRRRLVS